MTARVFDPDDQYLVLLLPPYRPEGETEDFLPGNMIDKEHSILPIPITWHLHVIIRLDSDAIE